MIVNKAAKLAVAAALIGGTLGGCRCGKDVSVEEEGRIDLPRLVEQRGGRVR